LSNSKTWKVVGVLSAGQSRQKDRAEKKKTHLRQWRVKAEKGAVAGEAQVAKAKE